MSLLAQIAPAAGHAWSFGEILIAVVVVVACLAIVYLIVTKAFGMTIPAWLIQIFWIVLSCVVAILAIRFLLSL